MIAVVVTRRGLRRCAIFWRIIVPCGFYCLNGISTFRAFIAIFASFINGFVISSMHASSIFISIRPINAISIVLLARPTVIVPISTASLFASVSSLFFRVILCRIFIDWQSVHPPPAGPSFLSIDSPPIPLFLSSIFPASFAPSLLITTAAAFLPSPAFTFRCLRSSALWSGCCFAEDSRPISSTEDLAMD